MSHSRQRSNSSWQAWRSLKTSEIFSFSSRGSKQKPVSILPINSISTLDLTKTITYRNNKHKISIKNSLSILSINFSSLLNDRRKKQRQSDITIEVMADKLQIADPCQSRLLSKDWMKMKKWTKMYWAQVRLCKVQPSRKEMLTSLARLSETLCSAREVAYRAVSRSSKGKISARLLVGLVLRKMNRQQWYHSREAKLDCLRRRTRCLRWFGLERYKTLAEMLSHAIRSTTRIWSTGSYAKKEKEVRSSLSSQSIVPRLQVWCPNLMLLLLQRVNFCSMR